MPVIFNPFDGTIQLVPASSGGGGGSVTSVNGQTGTVILDADDISSTAARKWVETSALSPDTIIISNSAGDGIESSAVLGLTATGGFLEQLTFQPNNLVQTDNLNAYDIKITPLQNSPDQASIVHNSTVQLDFGSTGFDNGTNGRAITIDFKNVIHSGTGDSGEVVLNENNLALGNGTDPISVRGISYSYGFGTINNAVTLVGPVQGYGFQPNFQAGSLVSSATYVSAFYDGLNAGSTELPNYISFNASPTIDSIANNSNYTGLNVNPTIDSYSGNSGSTGVAVAGNWGTVSNYWNGVNVNPNITLVENNHQAVGVNVSMDNVTLESGVASSLVIQDITYTWIQVGDNNSYSIEYTPGATAGSEVVTILGNAITIQIDSGVSTATQVKAAWDASQAATVINAVITGTASNPQVTAAQANFTGGENPGSKLAGFFDGDVQITGSLSFQGALSVGEFNAFYSEPLVNGGGNPTSGHTLITAPTVANNATVAMADYLGVNTAMLLQAGTNATITTAFLGVTALGLPAVVNLGSGTTIDRVGGAAFAISLDAGAGGGTIDTVALCRSLALPNGTTTVNRLYGYEFDLPFGDPGTDTWSFYSTQDVPAWMRGSLLVGGSAGGGNDRPTNTSVGVEINSTTKALLLSRMTTTERNALTAVAGMVIFNTTTNKFQGYDGTTWQDFH